MSNKVLLFTSALFVLVTSMKGQTSTIPSGDGSKEYPYQIESLEHLYWLSQNSEAWGEESNIEQTDDIDASATAGWFNGAGFTPIGNDTIGFSAHYNAKGHIIKGLTINLPTSKFIGLFGKMEGAYIDSLGIINYDITGLSNVGGLIGVNEGKSTVTNCYSSGSTKGKSNVGGLFGANKGHSTVENCYTTGFVTGISKLGGLIGTNKGREIISNCYSTASVSGDTLVGGLIGELNGSPSITNCYSAGFISGDTLVGGMIGQAEGFPTINGCFYNSDNAKQNDIGKGEPLTSEEMVISTSFSGWDIVSAEEGEYCWQILEGKTYPSLSSVSNNAPFAFEDTLTNGCYSLESLLNNDYDYETMQENLVYRIDSAVYMESDFNYADYFSSVEEGDSLKIVYSVGEILQTQNDTLWGNQAVSYFIFNSTTIASLTYKTDEEVSVYLPNITDLIKNPALKYSIDYPKNGVVSYSMDNKLYYTPYVDFNGTDSAEIHFTDLNIDLYIKIKFIVDGVNDAPVITSTATYSALKNVEYTYNLTAVDVDGDVLTYDLSNQPEGMEIDDAGVITWTPTGSVVTSGEVTASVTDGLLSNSETFVITVNPTDVTTNVTDTAFNNVQVYPNPVKSTLYVSGVITTGELYIYNLVGDLVKYIPSVEMGTGVDVSELPDGVYILKLKDENGITLLKIDKIK